jgi:hypothetical protein
MINRHFIIYHKEHMTTFAYHYYLEKDFNNIMITPPWFDMICFMVVYKIKIILVIFECTWIAYMRKSEELVEENLNRKSVIIIKSLLFYLLFVLIA